MRKKTSGKKIDPALLAKVLGGEGPSLPPFGRAGEAQANAIAQPAFSSFFHS